MLPGSDWAATLTEKACESEFPDWSKTVTTMSARPGLDNSNSTLEPT